MLDKSSYKLLKAFYKINSLSPHEVDQVIKAERMMDENIVVTHLIRNKFVARARDRQNEPFYHITIEGRAYIENRKKQFWSFFLPYLITTLIAFMSLLGTIAGNWKVIQSWFEA